MLFSSSVRPKTIQYKTKQLGQCSSRQHVTMTRKVVGRLLPAYAGGKFLQEQSNFHIMLHYSIFSQIGSNNFFLKFKKLAATVMKSYFVAIKRIGRQHKLSFHSFSISCLNSMPYVTANQSASRLENGLTCQQCIKTNTVTLSRGNHVSPQC